ncbi:hypothetical protein ABIC09_004966 [Bradyrhizobium sp. S3.12.5]|uniref:hypothetical protein n=1 Tax=Bradyrhizobium sp. S3.12.5 TaxID=3156386 RepID=UPI003391593E
MCSETESFRRRTAALFIGGLSLAGCTAIPEMPGDFQFPTQEILRYSVCELRDAYVELNDERSFPYFHAENYSIKIALQPKVDQEVDLKAGLTGKSTSLTKRYSNSWIGGAFSGGGGPGAGVDVRGHQDGTANFIIKSQNLISKKLVINCDAGWSPAKHALAQNLGIRMWLLKSSSAAQNDLEKVTIVDSHAFTAEIYVKFDAAGQFTYLFPLGTDFASAGGQYYTDQFLTITVTNDPPKKPITVRTIPGDIPDEEGRFHPNRAQVSAASPSPKQISDEARSRLDLLQLQQTLSNLQVHVAQ